MRIKHPNDCGFQTVVSTSETPSYTPGPWEISWGEDENKNGEFAIHSEVTICTGNDDAQCWRSNARLIAAAPELLEALEELLERAAPHGEEKLFSQDDNLVLKKVSAAIAKAKGLK